jgi:hypothetical protein
MVIFDRFNVALRCQVIPRKPTSGLLEFISTRPSPILKDEKSDPLTKNELVIHQATQSARPRLPRTLARTGDPVTRFLL